MVQLSASRGTSGRTSHHGSSGKNCMSFRIELPAYRGPLDLLLYLVRRHEVDLAEMSLSKIVDQYIDYIEVLKELDLTGVGDFIDLASTLVELKSQAVLPKIVDETAEETIEDPQTELVERLLQYKEIRDAASVLDEMGERWQQRYERMSDDLPTRRVDLGDQPIVDLEIWDLVSAFGRIMREAGGPPQTEVVYDDTPIHVYMQRIHEKLRGSDRLPLFDLVDGGIHKSAVIGWFLATLELTRHHGAAVEQSDTGDIYVVRTQTYSENLDVNEVDNYGAEEFKDANMPGMPR
ncbi:Segregation and condensation protein A [Rubripirellula lacrimiformis]|uniref:Segregation and condensation protein A n=2 Tax=Rubripirellula lacrimiformis TaxID=1930273 RepID=A0A517N8C5_9BACT|nr:Segregation and condensation protein A [Rubripirellula lacrimiformis]